MMAAATENQVSSMQRHVKTLINKDLQSICRAENLPVSGLKAQLQTRVLQYLTALVDAGDQRRLEILRHRIYNHGATPVDSPSDLPSSNTPRTTGSSSYNLPAIGMASHMGNMPSLQMSSQPRLHTTISFKPSPFFEIGEPLAKTIELPAYSTHRNTMTQSVILSQEMADKLRSDNTMRVLLFCAVEPLPHGSHQTVDINFPQQLEIRVNQHEVKANFKGLKNKPGSTLPADITGFIRKHAGFSNVVSVTYALTTKRYYIVTNLVKKHSVEELAERITTRSVISRQRVITAMITKANDPDIVATSTKMSLKDPVSYMRISIPVRSSVCQHNQCFDAACFLQLQEQAPTWTCPICQKLVAYESLCVDQYVQEILQSTSRNTEQVMIEPNGNWSTNDPKNTSTNGTNPSPDGDESDDLVEIVETSRPSVKVEAPNTPFSMNMTPPVPSPGWVASAPLSRGTKRTSEVIDLTLDDDDEPPAKRPALTPVERVRNGYQTTSRNPSFNQITNGNVSFQQLGRTFGGVTPYSPSYQTTSAGSPLAPITISSPPSRPSPVQPDYSNATSYPQQQDRQPSHHPPPIRQGSSASTSTTNPAQRATLLSLAGRTSFGE
ncbi:hypothetical protein EJ08DRAFT_653500 [Tothia fuscella]|uniref:Uncharacterized protein n=1 Tax=Tothia fuscella TaxID=1048955 RepID=A0A9P4TTM0_9PEZI|nr:hypothetical protein EJ08DRAFT_653500 [Tothia fuscella]